jgi:hypothetical protein
MRNPFSFKIETIIGSVIVFAVASFFVGYFLISMKNFSTDIDTLNATAPVIKDVIPHKEIEAMRNWLDKNDPELVKASYRQAVSKYPDKPWLTDTQSN